RQKGAWGTPRGSAPRRTHRRNVEDARQIDMKRGMRSRGRQTREPHGHKAQAIENGADAEELEGQRFAQKKQPLSDEQRTQIDRDIERENSAPRLIGRSIIEPAL